MEIFDREVIFSMSFPRTDIDEVKTEASELCKTVPYSSEEIVDKFFKKYTYVPRFNAEERLKEFISYATEVCKDYEINTEISRKKYSVDISMDIGFGWFGGHIKHVLEKLINFADDISFFSREDDADALIIVMSYYTHDRYANGEG